MRVIAASPKVEGSGDKVDNNNGEGEEEEEDDDDDKTLCSLLAVQPLECPIHDEESAVTHFSRRAVRICGKPNCRNFDSNYRWQTMLTTATIDVELKDKYADGFYVMAVTKKTNIACKVSIGLGTNIWQK